MLRTRRGRRKVAAKHGGIMSERLAPAIGADSGSFLPSVRALFGEEPVVSAVSIACLQAYLRYSARRQSETIAAPPFRLFLRPGSEASEDDHAVPEEPRT